jgi:hypothetical protein
MKKIGLMLGAFVLSGLSFGQTFLSPTPYLQFSDSPWATGSFDYFHLDTVEDHLLNTPGATLAAGIVTSSSFGLGAIVDSVDEDDGAINGTNGNNGVFGDSLFGAEIRVEFSAAVLGNLPNYAGMVWTDGGVATFEAFDENGVSLGTVVNNSSDGGNFGGTDEDRFFGVEYAGGISAIRFIGSSNEADHLQYGYSPVPEPASMTLLGLGALALLRRKKS